MVALDTNVLVYAWDRAEPVKRRKARELLQALRRGEESTVLPWQVLLEFAACLRRNLDRGKLDRTAMIRILRVTRALFPVVMPSERVIDFGLVLSTRYSLSHWDAMLLGACVDAGAETLYTEDIGAPRTIGALTLINPFA